MGTSGRGLSRGFWPNATLFEAKVNGSKHTPKHAQVHGKLGDYQAAIECYRRSIAVSPAAPAYVAWALVVAKLADRAQRDLSTTKVREEGRKAIGSELNGWVSCPCLRPMLALPLL